MVHLSGRPNADQHVAPALSEPAVRAAVRRVGQLAALCLVGGLVLLVGFVTAVSLVDSAANNLRQHGGQSTGHVDTLTPDAQHSVGGATISYLVAGHRYTGRQDLGSNAANYRVGQSVTVYYDPRHPSRFTINDETNQPAWTVWTMCVALVGGLIGLGFGVSFGLRWHRLRRVLAGWGWQPAWFEAGPRTIQGGTRTARRGSRTARRGARTARSGSRTARIRLAGPDGCPAGAIMRYRVRAPYGGSLVKPWADLPRSAEWDRHGRRQVPGRIAGPGQRWAVLSREHDTAVLLLVRSRPG